MRRAEEHQRCMKNEQQPPFLALSVIQSLATPILVSLEATVQFLTVSVLPRRTHHSWCVTGAAKHHRFLVSLRWGWSSPVGHLVQLLLLPSPQPYLWLVPRSDISSLVPFKLTQHPPSWLSCSPRGLALEV